MKYIISCLIVLLPFFQTIHGQEEFPRILLNPDVIEGKLIRVSEPLRDFSPPPFDGDIVKGSKLGYHPKSDWILNDSINPNAKPNGWDPAWQKEYAPARNTKALIQNFNGLGNNGVNPPDPALDVGPNHVIQMINGPGGAYFIIYDKAGTVLVGQTYFDSWSTIPGLGDPIVLYDQFADRWMMSEFASGSNSLIIAISQTADPTGSWYFYSYSTPNFPDYPKYGIWDDAYVCTTNESQPAIYAFDRTQMLNGTAGSSQRFTVASYGTIGFQALTPADVDGNTAPPNGEPAIVMRMADDAWDPGLSQDQLEIFEFDIDFNTPGNTSLQLVQTLATDPFDTHLCGYTSFACIPQQGSGVTLDPLREVIMNRIQYRNFGSYEAMVLCHATDVDGNDRAGVRWYELRRTTGNWTIHQQGTYSPDTESRWMASIAINSIGDIGLAYSTSSSSSFPSLKYTGRKICDPLGTMTEPETNIVIGGGANGSNRYGDYASMSVDPSDGTFWFTGEYNPTTAWSTRITKFDIGGSCTPEVSFSTGNMTINETDADVINSCLDYKTVDVTIGVSGTPSADPTVTLVLGGSATQGVDYEAPGSLSATLTSPNYEATFSFDIYNDAYVEMDEILNLSYTLNANGGDATTGAANQMVDITIVSEDLPPSGSTGVPVTLLDEDFESNTLGSFTTSNPSGDTPWQAGDEPTAQTTAFDIPTYPAGSTYAAYVNDDDCDCNQNEVNLFSPILDLTNLSSADLVFDYYFEDETYLGDPEDLDVLISINGGTTFTLLEDLAGTGTTAFQIGKTISLNSYVNQSNVQINFRYSDGTGWLYGAVIDNVVVEGITAGAPIQLAVNSGMPAEEYLGPNTTVHYYDPASNNIMLSLTNNSNHDFGCTTVEVDRPGTSPSAVVFNDPSSEYFVTSKTFKITPTNSSGSASYDIELYYEEAEIAAWESATSNSRSVVEVVKVAGNNQISDVTPANAATYDISYYDSSLSAYDTDVIVTASIPSGFSGFALGKELLSSPTCSMVETNTWVGPSTANWNDSASNWSLSLIPTQCHHVVIPSGNNITILNGNMGFAFTIDIQSGAEVDVQSNATLDVIAPN